MNDKRGIRGMPVNLSMVRAFRFFFEETLRKE